MGTGEEEGALVILFGTRIQLSLCTIMSASVMATEGYLDVSMEAYRESTKTASAKDQREKD